MAYSSNSILQIVPKPFQSKFLFSGARYPAMISAWATGKTMMGILRMMICMENVSNNLGLIVRKEYTDLHDSTIQDFERYTGLKVNSEKDVLLPNGSKIMFRHGKELDVLKNINLGAFMIEQAEEFETDEQFQFLRGRLRRADVPFHTGFIVGNTKGQNWIWRIWKNNPPSPEYELIEATTFDNSDNLPKDFLEDLKRLEMESPQHYKRYVLNSWEDFEDIDSLIPLNFITQCINQNFSPQGGKILACDPAHYGDCKTVITILQRAGFNRYKQIYLFAKQGQDLMQTAGQIVNLHKEHNFDHIIIDDIGIGVGISDRLAEEGISVIRYKGSEKSILEGFTNKRSQDYWKLREMLGRKSLDLIDNTEQTAQLSSLKYKFKSNGTKYIESKEDARNRGIASPDYADALMMACSVIELAKEPEINPTRGEEFWQMVKRDIELSKLREREEEENEDTFRSL